MGGESLLNELHMWRSDWKIMVKVYKRWETTNADDHKWIDFILVDEEVRSFLYHFFHWLRYLRVLVTFHIVVFALLMKT